MYRDKIKANKSHANETINISKIDASDVSLHSINNVPGYRETELLGYKDS